MSQPSPRIRVGGMHTASPFSSPVSPAASDVVISFPFHSTGLAEPIAHHQHRLGDDGLRARAKSARPCPLVSNRSIQSHRITARWKAIRQARERAVERTERIRVVTARWQAIKLARESGANRIPNQATVMECSAEPAHAKSRLSPTVAPKNATALSPSPLSAR